MLRSRAGLQGFRSETWYQIFEQVWNRVGKITDFGLKLGKGFRKRAAHPHPTFLEVPPSPTPFFVVFRTQIRGHCARCSLRRLWKLGLRIVPWSKPWMFCEESLGKVKFRAFPKRVGPRILSLESVDYCEHYWLLSGRGKKMNLN